MWEGLWRFPLVYLIVFGLRFALLTGFRPLFRLEGSDLPVRDALFATVAGLRGSVALILAQAVITAGDSEAIAMGKVPPEEIRVRAEIVLWTALFVLCTLLINAPLLPKVLRLTKLDVIPDARLALRRRALRALDAHTASAVAGLRSEEDAMMAGVDWARVRELTKVGGASDFASFAEQAGGGGRSKESEEKARRRKHLKSLGAFEMRHGVSDAWEGLSRLCRVSAAAVARFFGLGGGARKREEDVSFGAAADATHHLDPRRQKSASSMATIFLDEAGAVAKHYRVFGRTISMSHSR